MGDAAELMLARPLRHNRRRIHKPAVLRDEWHMLGFSRAFAQKFMEEEMTARPLLARATFGTKELTPDQIARVAGGDLADEVGEGGPCNSQNPHWSIVPTWDTTKSNPADQKSVCTDY